MSDTFTNQTTWINATRTLPPLWDRRVINERTIVLGEDLQLCVQRVIVSEGSGPGSTHTVVGDGYTVELFDADGNHLTTVAASTREHHIDVPALIPVVLSWPWTKDFVTVTDTPDHDHLPFSGLA